MEEGKLGMYAGIALAMLLFRALAPESYAALSLWLTRRRPTPKDIFAVGPSFSTTPGSLFLLLLRCAAFLVGVVVAVSWIVFPDFGSWSVPAGYVLLGSLIYFMIRAMLMTNDTFTALPDQTKIRITRTFFVGLPLIVLYGYAVAGDERYRGFWFDFAHGFILLGLFFVMIYLVVSALPASQSDRHDKS